MARYTRFALALMIGLVTSTPLWASTIVVAPPEDASMGGTGFSCYPFMNPSQVPTCSGAQHYQQIYDASNFGWDPSDPTVIGASGLIDTIAFRLQEGRSLPPGSETIDFRVTLSTSSKSSGTMSSTFADNVGSDAVIVFDGTKTFGALGTPGSNVANPNPFDVLIDVANLFTYHGGNLLMDIWFRGGALGTVLDSVRSGSGMQRVWTSTPADGFGCPCDPNSPTGHIGGDIGLVTQFQLLDAPPPVASVPEPASLLLLGTGLSFMARRFRNRRTADSK